MIFTVKEYVPGYLGLESYYITYNLNDKTITVGGRTKAMSKYRYNKALEYLMNIADEDEDLFDDAMYRTLTRLER